ncbi:LuxR family transcriptional regulator [Streptomyces sp. NBRC 109706]|uniref:helix-turn-helix transcriptional regulator n=1 Tax=Streptomyces sp. NBRC 109706 TaxID=1550035 RepID=UPI00082FD060|nr:LuxR family transcriptional regulator [Streptomyces sp. NBRC 109706]
MQREAQLTQLRSILENCTAQQGGRVCLVTGAVGSGKTALLETFSDYATRRSSTVVSAVGSRAERDFPFGVMGQLISGAGLDFESAWQIIDVMRRAQGTDPEGRGGANEHPPSRDADHEFTSAVNRFLSPLEDAARTSPLVLTVDDVHHADIPSLNCLLYVIRRLRPYRIMVVLTESETLRSRYPLFWAELMSQPHLTGLALPALDGAAIARLVGPRPPADIFRKVSKETLAATGGNPLLVRGLLDDERLWRRDSSDADPTPGTFAQAILRSFYRHEPEVRATAQAMAVLARPTSLQILARLLDHTPEFTGQAVRLLHASGLAEAGGLRHPHITRTVLTDLPADERRRLHRRAAEILHEHGTEPGIVAEHLVSSDWAEPSWAGQVLREAADQAMARGRPDITGACLRLIPCDAGTARWSEENALLLHSRWQINPLSITTQLNQLEETACSGGELGPAALSAVPFLVWRGPVDSALEIVARLGTQGGHTPETKERLEAARLLISLSRPDFLPEARSRERLAAHTDPESGTSSGGQQLEALTLLADVLSQHRAPAEVVACAGRLMQRHLAEEGPTEPLEPTLLASLYAGRPDLVIRWTRALLERASAQHSPTWKAKLRTLRASAALRLGQLQEAEEQGRLALAELTPQAAWGVNAVGPLATLVSLATEARRMDEASHWLARPVPTEAFQTTAGLHYLAARARYRLAAGRRHAAANDLRQCGETMRRWQMDTTTLVPWRLELARVQIALDDRAEAARLLTAQLARETGLDDRTRGAAMRLLATLEPATSARSLLSAAVEILESCGDQVELARALANTAQIKRGSGDAKAAHQLFQRAHQVAKNAGASVLAQSMLAAVGTVPARLPSARPRRTEHRLSQAERRVATLAAQGHTNRQISSKLFITVSTVEQHLTRIYRKLQVKHRSDLANRLTTAGAGVPQLDA